MGHTLDTIGHYGHYIADAAAVATGNPELIPAIEGVNSGGQTLAHGGGLFNALKSGGLSAGGAYLGGQIGGSLGGNLGTIGNAAANVGINLGQSVAPNGLGSAIGNAIGDFAPTFGSTLGNMSLGSALGGAFGLNAANSLSQPAPKTTPTSFGTAPFKPTQAAQMQLPASLSGMSTLNPDQQVSGLANQGTYGGGLGPQEQDYFLNMENRKLVDPQGHVGSMGSLSPIEQSYLQQLGLSGYDNSTSLLEAMSKRKPT